MAARRAADAQTSPRDSSRAVPLPAYDAGHASDFDPWTGWEDEHLPPHPLVDEEALASELRKVLRRGLPLTSRSAGEVLPNLRSVIARSTHPYDLSSRVDALNRLLVRMIVDLGDEPSGRALGVLFGIAKGTRGTTLSSRQEKAAAVAGYDVTHCRKRVQPKLLYELAQMIYADLLRYKRRIRRAPQSEEPTGDTPSITADSFSHQEELVSRIWQHVYGLRAELIAVGRLEADLAYASQAEDHRHAAERERSALDDLMREYVETYGVEFVRHGEAEYSVSALQRAAWG